MSTNKKKEKKNDNINDKNNANVIESGVREIVIIVSEMQIDMVSEVIMAALTESSNWCYDSGNYLWVQWEVTLEDICKSLRNKGIDDGKFSFRESTGKRDIGTPVQS